MSRILFHSLLAGCSLADSALTGAILTVNTTATSREPDQTLSLVEAILVVNGVRSARAALTEAERAQIRGEPGGGDRIEFAIPGDDVHLIALPEKGLPSINRSGTVIDGFSQPGTKPNDAGIHEPNNAVLRIVIDGRNGQVNSEQDLLTIKGNDVVVRGLSFLSTFDTTVYGINFRDQATGGQVSGCWVGVHPDGGTVSGGEIGIGVCCGTGGGHVIGTNGDGVDDRAEFNVIVGQNVSTIVEEASGVRISGNFIGLMPDGLSLPPGPAMARVIEGDAIEGAFADDLLVGTNGDGIGDADEGNVIGGMGNEVIEFWDGANDGFVFAGNYVGVGIDGTTPLGNQKFMRVSGVRARIGTNFDGVSDELESNILAHHQDALFEYRSDRLFLNVRGNQMFENLEPIFSEVGTSFFGTSVGDADRALFPRLLPGTSGDRLVAEVPLSDEAGIGPAELDLYLADAGTLGISPQGATFLGRFTDNGPGDRDDRKRQMDVSLSELRFPFTGPAHYVALSFIAEAGEDGKFSVSDVSDPFEVMITATPEAAVPPLSIAIDRHDAGALTLTYQGILESADRVEGPWTRVESASPHAVPPEAPQQFFRVVAP